MSRYKRLQRIASIADVASRGASQGVAAAREAMAADAEHLEKFRSYRDEYVNEMGVGSQAANIARLRELRAFVGQIDQAIGALEAQAQGSSERYQQAVLRWQHETRRSNVLSGIMEKTRRQDDETRERSEQRELDGRPPPANSFD